MPKVDFSKPIQVRLKNDTWHDVIGSVVIDPVANQCGCYIDDTWSPDAIIAHVWASESDLRNDPDHQPLLDFNKPMQVRFANVWFDVVDCMMDDDDPSCISIRYRNDIGTLKHTWKGIADLRNKAEQE